MLFFNCSNVSTFSKTSRKQKSKKSDTSTSYNSHTLGELLKELENQKKQKKEKTKQKTEQKIIQKKWAIQAYQNLAKPISVLNLENYNIIREDILTRFNESDKKFSYIFNSDNDLSIKIKNGKDSLIKIDELQRTLKEQYTTDADKIVISNL